MSLKLFEKELRKECKKAFDNLKDGKKRNKLYDRYNPQRQKD